MDENQESSPSHQDPYSQWMKTAMETWEPMLRMWTDAASAFFGSRDGIDPTKKKDRFQAALDASTNTFFAVLSAMGQSSSSDALLKRTAAFPQAWMKMANTALQAFSDLQRLWVERMSRIHASTQAYQFENLDENVFKIWKEVYEKEIRPYIRVPQLGPARFYQEQFNETLDAFNRFQTGLGEFFRLLYLPVEKSLEVLQESLKQKAEAGALPKTSKEFYQEWIKILEGHYMTLFKSEEYTGVLKNTLDVMEEFLEKRKRLVSDWARLFCLPTQDEMDALYKEIYLLKKRLRVLEKRTSSGQR